VVARFIQRRSPRRDNSFVALNCAAIAETLLESELFGHEKGAFTGAAQTRRGRFELAHCGTLFLDEVAEMGLNLQAKFLRVLQERQFERVGGQRSISVDVRVIAATNKVMAEALAARLFREDLYYRLNVFPIRIPPLRERRDDVLPLAEHFVRKFSQRMGKPVPRFTAEATELLRGYGWPGNVRELSNAIERALIVSQAWSIEPEDLPLQPQPTPENARPGSLAELEKNAILNALMRNNGDRKATAEQLGISLRTLQYRLKDYGVSGRD
jgi:transcriptional regulator with PAS, ATPase and Fis domain